MNVGAQSGVVVIEAVRGVLCRVPPRMYFCEEGEAVQRETTTIDRTE